MVAWVRRWQHVSIHRRLFSSFMLCVLDSCDTNIHSAVFISTGVTILLQEYILGGQPMRFALVLTIPFVLCVSLVSHPEPPD